MRDSIVIKMIGVKSTLVLLLCVTCAKGDVHNITVDNLTHVTNGSFYDPTVLKLRNELVYVSYPKINDDVVINLESNAFTQSKNSCQIVIPVPSNRTFLSPRAASLSNEKILVTFVETQLENSENDEEPRVRFYLVDAFDHCNYTNFTSEFDNGILQSYEPFIIIPYRDTFDIVAKSHSRCKTLGSICLIRYNTSGSLIDTLNFDFETFENSLDTVKLYPVKEHDPTEGYVYFSKAKSTMSRLDENLKTIKEQKLRGYISTVSVLNGDIGVCIQIEEIDRHTECLKLDQRLKVKSRVSLSNPHYYVSRRLYNLGDGTSLIGSISMGKISTLLRRVTEDGRVSQSELYRYECETPVTDPLDNFVELRTRVYCFSYACRFAMITHCTSSDEAHKLFLY